MSDEPVLADIALRLDPLDQDALAKFRKYAEHLIADLDDDLQTKLKDRLSSSVQSMALASISEEASLNYRAELIAAANAIEKATAEIR